MKHSPLLGRLGLLIVDEDQKLMPSTSYLMANPTETDTAVTGEVPMKAQQRTTTQICTKTVR